MSWEKEEEEDREEKKVIYFVSSEKKFSPFQNSGRKNFYFLPPSTFLTNKLFLFSSLCVFCSFSLKQTIFVLAVSIPPFGVRSRFLSPLQLGQNQNLSEKSNRLILLDAGCFKLLFPTTREHSPLGEASLYGWSPVLQGCIRLLH